MNITQYSTTYPLQFLMVQSSDHLTPATGVSPTVKINKNGGGFVTPSGAIGEVGNGWYAISGNSYDTNTIGEIIVHATASGADISDRGYYSISVSGSSGSSVNVTQIGGQNVSAASPITFPATVASTAPTVTQIAAAILTNPGNLLTTDASGKVGINNLPVEFLSSTEQTELTTTISDLTAILSSDTAFSGNFTTIQTILNNLNTRLSQAILFDGSGNVKSANQTPVALLTGQSVSASNLPSDYQQRGVAVTLPTLPSVTLTAGQNIAANNLPTDYQQRNVAVTLPTLPAVTLANGQSTAANNLPTDYARSGIAPSWYVAPDNTNVQSALNDLVTLLNRTDPTTALTAIQNTSNSILSGVNVIPAAGKTNTYTSTNGTATVTIS